jgi:hypothetical protein
MLRNGVAKEVCGANAVGVSLGHQFVGAVS